MIGSSRREFMKTASLAAFAAAAGTGAQSVRSQDAGVRPYQAEQVSVINPRGRVPLSFIIDDSTCLVNLAHFAIPHFHDVFPDRYQQDWRSLPREIPDDFVRKFASWCGEHGVKGKYSVVPYPACVGWLDRDLPGWSKQALDASLRLVRDELPSNWDFHPEMVSHTWVINTKTGRPYPERSEYFMENWRWTDGKSVDELADYLSYALRILRNVDIPCEGITTPGGFGNRVLPQLSQATLESCRDVFQAEIPHYFRHLYTDETSVAPRVEYASGIDGPDPQCVVSIIGCTGDWFGGWDGLVPGDPDRFITPDLSEGRMVEVIERGEPAIMVCHWPGIYYNGDEHGFKVLQTVVDRMHQKYDHLIWMKLSEIARYWAARELTRIEWSDDAIAFHAPYACEEYTVQIQKNLTENPRIHSHNRITELQPAPDLLRISPQQWHQSGDMTTICFDLPKGESFIKFT